MTSDKTPYIVWIRVKINVQAINCNKSQLQFTTQLFCELKSLKHTHIIHLVKIGVTKGGNSGRGCQIDLCPKPVISTLENIFFLFATRIHFCTNKTA